MIIEYTPVANGYGSRWDIGEATLILPLGHGEYGLPENDKVRVELWDAYGEEPKPHWLVAHEEALIAVGGNYAEPLVEGGWGMLALLQGPFYELWKMFYQFSNRLDPEQDPADYTPGGDDDAYDYYPSAFECMEQWAKDLDTMDEQYEAALVEHSKNWPEHMRRYVVRARHAFTARHRITSIVNNLRIAKGDFAEWEFQDYAAPYVEALQEN